MKLIKHDAKETQDIIGKVRAELKASHKMGEAVGEIFITNEYSWPQKWDNLRQAYDEWEKIKKGQRDE